ncbi:MAG: hypothetical protein IJ682_05580 [Lachnospiraceae bacterium]|nr:hypothetical protein [Lachnospiraceae bacterium]
MSTVYLHIGTAKTGTTSLQRFFQINKKVFKKKGFSYPEMPFTFKDAADARNAHFLTLWNDQADDRWSKGFEIVRKKLEKYDNIILSDEQLWIVQPAEGFWESVKDEIAKLGADLKVIVYLRPQDQMAESHWNQRVKGRPKLAETFTEFLNGGGYNFFPLDYGKTVDWAADHVGRENLTVRVFEQQQFTGGSLFADFLQILGLGLSDEYRQPAHVSNLRLPDNVVEIKRLINSIDSYQKSGIPNFYWDAIRKSYGLGTMKEIPEHKAGMFSPEEREEYMSQFAESNAHVAKEYLNRADGKLFYGELSELPKWQMDEREMLMDIIRVFAGADVYLYQRQEELAAELRELYNSLPFRAYRKLIGNKENPEEKA